MDGDYKTENRCSNLKPRVREYSLSLVKDTRLSYIPELLDNPLSRAHHAGIYTVCDNPGNVHEPANTLNKVAYEK